MADDSRPSTRARAFSAFIDGAFSTLQSIPAAFHPSSWQAAARQASHFAQAVTHPRRSAIAVRDAFEAERHDLDVPHTFARTAGDIAGSAATLAGLTFVAAMAFRRPYLRSRFGAGLMHRYSTAPFLQHRILQHPRLRTFAVTRPLTFGVGAALSGAAFIGSARERAASAVENQQTHPSASAILQRNNLHELAATPVSRAVRARSSSDSR